MTESKILLSFTALLQEELESLKQKGLYRKLRVLEDGTGNKASFEGREVRLFCGNDYLGLSRHPRVKKAMREAAEKEGAGAGAARLISGTSKEHAALEEKIARFKNKESALVYTAGYLANLGVLTSLAGEGDLLVMDKLCHASLIDGARLSGAQVRVFPHKNYDRCAEILEKSENFRKKIIVSDTVFSMDGDLADIARLAEIKKKYQAVLILDDAHGVGVFGKKGTGAAEGFESGIDVITGTLSKSAGSIGGFAACSGVVRDYLVNTSRPFIFATALPSAVCAAARESFCVMEESPALREVLWSRVKIFYEGLTSLNIPVPAVLSPIVPIMVGPEKEASDLAGELLKEGFLIPAIRTPSVPKDKARLRVTLSAAHSEQDVADLLKALKKLEKRIPRNPL